MRTGPSSRTLGGVSCQSGVGVGGRVCRHRRQLAPTAVALLAFDVEALFGVGLVLPCQQCMGLAGHNGCGEALGHVEGCDGE